MDDRTPPLTSPDHLPKIRTPEDLHALWRMLMGPLGFGGHSLWVHLLDEDGRPTPVILQIEDLPPTPDLMVRENIERFLSHLVQDAPGSIAFLLSRPGRKGLTADERCWAEALADVTRQLGLRPWPVHRANDHELVVVALDDLADSA
jgi:hypothetical protein